MGATSSRLNQPCRRYFPGFLLCISPSFFLSWLLKHLNTHSSVPGLSVLTSAGHASFLCLFSWLLFSVCLSYIKFRQRQKVYMDLFAAAAANQNAQVGGGMDDGEQHVPSSCPIPRSPTFWCLGPAFSVERQSPSHASFMAQTFPQLPSHISKWLKVQCRSWLSPCGRGLYGELAQYTQPLFS